MKKISFFLLSVLLAFSASSQYFKPEDAVEVDILLGDTAKNNWKKATYLGYDSVTKVYKVKVLDGDKMDIPSSSPEKWIRPAIDRNLVIKYGPGAKLPYMNRVAAIQAIDCRPTEKYVRKNLRSQMAAQPQYKEFEWIYVDVTMVKPQHGYDDPKNKGQFIYPYKIEMLVHLKRTVQMGGRLYTEYQTWEYDREYAYATRGKKKCEFYPQQTAGPEFICRGWFPHGW